jgi:hypothetical protein
MEPPAAGSISLNPAPASNRHNPRLRIFHSRFCRFRITVTGDTTSYCPSSLRSAMPSISKSPSVSLTVSSVNSV